MTAVTVILPTGEELQAELRGNRLRSQSSQLREAFRAEGATLRLPDGTQRTFKAWAAWALDNAPQFILSIKYTDRETTHA